MAGDLRVMGSNPGRNLKATFDTGLPQIIQEKVKKI